MQIRFNYANLLYSVSKIQNQKHNIALMSTLKLLNITINTN